MSKRICAKVEEYQKDGQMKGKYVEIGVILNNQNGDYMLIDPSVSLSGVLAKQNAMEFVKGGQIRSNIMCSIFDDSQHQNQNNQQGGFNQSQQNNNQQGGFGNQQNNGYQNQ